MASDMRKSKSQPIIAKRLSEQTERNVKTITSMERADEEQRTPGECVADFIAKLVGSWPFIIAQSCILAAWITLNVVAVIKHWDPYPFILLNLALSFQAAYTGPIVMMSQNRQSNLADRRNKLDLQINMLTEQENTQMLYLLRLLCEKQGIALEPQVPVETLEQETDPQMLSQQLKKAADENADAGKADNQKLKDGLS